MNEAEEKVSSFSDVMITTDDNPYDYFTEFIQWYMFDTEHEYNTCSLLDHMVERVGGITDDMNVREANDVIELAIERILAIIPVEYHRIYRK